MTISEIAACCVKLKAREELVINKFGHNHDLTLSILKDEDYNSETGEYNLVSICTAKNGIPVDDTGDIHMSELFAELCRINNYQNLRIL